MSSVGIDFFASSAGSVKWENNGDTVRGVITEMTQEQQREHKSKDPNQGPKFWKDGRPALMLVVALQTDLRDNGDDNGERKLYINKPSRLLEAISEALKAAKVKGLEEGGTLQVKYTGDVKTDAGTYARTFSAAYQPPKAGDGFFAESKPEATPAPAPEAAVGLPAGFDISSLPPAAAALLASMAKK